MLVLHGLAEISLTRPRHSLMRGVAVPVLAVRDVSAVSATPRQTLQLKGVCSVTTEL